MFRTSSRQLRGRYQPFHESFDPPRCALLLESCTKCNTAEVVKVAFIGTERELYVNVRNGELITSLPEQCCVEVPCRVGAGGAVPQPVGALPPQLGALNRTFLNVVELTVRAALDGNVQHVYQAALLDPNASATLTTEQIVAMCDDLLDAHKALFPPGLAR